MYCDYFDCPMMHLFRQQFPGGPPFGGPGGGPGGPPFGGPGGPGAGSRPPSSPPPSFAPQKSQVQTFAVSPGSIRPCLFRYTYIWPRRGRGFWAFPIRVDSRSVSGWRWTGHRWAFFGMDLRQIESFQCF
ncbi:MAG: hypothetical protein F8N39_08255 [Clostridiaceae bacterium]|nr:hypothetical protein [Clostridiaceae bacterium]